MDEITCTTAKEVVSILYNSDMNVFLKIPPKFIVFLENKANECKEEIVINKCVGIEKQSISDDAKAILAIIYKDFLASNDKKEKIKKELSEKIASEPARRTADDIKNDKINMEMVVYKEESRLKKILNRIKRFFSKK